MITLLYYYIIYIIYIILIICQITGSFSARFSWMLLKTLHYFAYKNTWNTIGGLKFLICFDFGIIPLHLDQILYHLPYSHRYSNVQSIVFESDFVIWVSVWAIKRNISSVLWCVGRLLVEEMRTVVTDMVGYTAYVWCFFVFKSYVFAEVPHTQRLCQC